MRTRILLVTLVSLFGVALGLTQGAPASAGRGPLAPAMVQAKLAGGPGPSGYVTIWDGCGSAGNGYCGAAWPIPVGTIGSCYSMPSGSNDKASAVDNHTSHTIKFYRDGGCSNTSYTIYAGTYTGALTSGQGNNAWSS